MTQKSLRDLRQALLRLHKALLDSERIEYERKNGRIRTSGEFLNLVTQNEFFIWLRSLSELIVQFDIALDGKDKTTQRSSTWLFRQAQALLKPAHARSEFSRKLNAAIQRSPEVVIAMGDVSAVIINPTVH